MCSAPSPRYEEIETVVSTAGLDLSASEVHGLICGALCNQMKTGSSPDLNRLLAVAADVQPDALQRLQKTLGLLLRRTLEDLHQESGAFDLLLPGDAVELPLRLRALADWCRGFLLGLLNGDGLAIDELGADSAEIARDMLSMAEVEADRGGSDSEWDLAQVREYFRVGVQLIFEELYGELRGGVASGGLH